MKKVQTPFQVMEQLVTHLASAYSKSEIKHKGKIQFYLTHKSEKITCYFDADGEELKLHEGETANPIVSLKSSFYHWLDLAAKRLNPVLGVITGKLKFTGDTSFFSKIMVAEEPDFDITLYDDPPTDFEKAPQKYWNTPKDILVINGSPRSQNGYTDFYLRPFITGMKKSGVSVESVELAKHKINSCKGCWECWLSGTGECVFKDKDDFNQVYKKLTNADLVVYAFPLYLDGVPGILKNFIDRSTCSGQPFMVDGLTKVRHPRRVKKNKSTVVFSVCGFLGKENFYPVRDHFRAISYNKHSPLVGEIFRSGAIYLYNHPFLFEKLNEILQALEQAGKEIVRSGKMNKTTIKCIEQKIGNIDDFKKESNRFWNKNIADEAKTY